MKYFTKQEVLQELKNKIGKGEGQMSQRALAAILGVTENYLSSVVNGRKPVVPLIEKLGFAEREDKYYKVKRK